MCARHTKVFDPPICAGMKQPRERAGGWIERGQIGALVVIASPADASENVQGGRAAVLSGDDVVNLWRVERQPVGHTAVLAALFGSFNYLPTQGGWEVPCAHLVRSRREVGKSAR